MRRMDKIQEHKREAYKILEKQVQLLEEQIESVTKGFNKMRGDSKIKKKLWYCRQCGYVVFREDPPYICPICKAKKELFDKIGILLTSE